MTQLTRAVPAILMATALALAATPAHAATTIRIKDAHGDQRGVGAVAAETTIPAAALISSGRPCG